MTRGEKVAFLVEGKQVAWKLFSVPQRIVAVFAEHAAVAVAAAVAEEEDRSLDIEDLVAEFPVEGLALELASVVALDVALAGLACAEVVHGDVVAYLVDWDCKLQDVACRHNRWQVVDEDVAEEQDSSSVFWVRLH